MDGREGDCVVTSPEERRRWRWVYALRRGRSKKGAEKMGLEAVFDDSLSDVSKKVLRDAPDLLPRWAMIMFLGMGMVFVGIEILIDLGVIEERAVWSPDVVMYVVMVTALGITATAAEWTRSAGKFTALGLLKVLERDAKASEQALKDAERRRRGQQAWMDYH